MPQLPTRLVQELNVGIVRGALTCLAYFLNMLSIGVSTTGHWQTSGRLLQESDVCTVKELIDQFLLLPNS